MVTLLAFVWELSRKAYRGGGRFEALVNFNRVGFYGPDRHFPNKPLYTVYIEKSFWETSVAIINVLILNFPLVQSNTNSENMAHNTFCDALHPWC